MQGDGNRGASRSGQKHDKRKGQEKEVVSAQRMVTGTVPGVKDHVEGGR